MLSALANRLDDQEQSIGAVDCTGYAVGHSGPGKVAFGKVMKPLDTLRVVVAHQEHGTGPVFPSVRAGRDEWR